MSREAGEIQFFHHFLDLRFLFVNCTSVVPFLFGNAGKVASMTLVKGPRSRGTMTSFLCATLAALFG